LQRAAPNHLVALLLVLMVVRRWLVQDHLIGKASWYKARALECSALAKSARTNFVREIYRKAAAHYAFAEGVLQRRMEQAVGSPGVTTLT
jgi:hypothetical protein